MIRNIIFDLGNVLVNVEYERFINKLMSCGVTEESYSNFFKGGSYRLLGYESGDISTDEFISRCLNGLDLKMEPNDFAAAFNDMFSEITPMKELVEKLSFENKYNLYMLSNTSPLHFEHIRNKYQHINLLEKFALSYELKALKPDSSIYQRTIRHLNITPQESVFIDDLPENCKAANTFGINTVCYDKNDHDKFVTEFDTILKQKIFNKR